MSGPYPYYGPTGPQDWINEFRLDGEYALIGEDGDHFLKWKTQPMTLLVRGRFNVNNHAHVVQGIAENHTDWFRWFFANRDITQFLTRQGASRYKLTKATLACLPCAIPSPKEQRAIADALTDADTLIDSLEQLLTKKRQIKQGAMQELLTGKRRLPGFIKAWTHTTLAQVADMKSGLTITASRLQETYRYPCYGGNGLRGFTDSFTHEGSYALIGRQGALCGNVCLAKGRFYASEHAVVVTTHKNVDVIWLHYVLIRMNLNQYSESSAQPGLSVEKLLKLELNVPEFSEQQAIGEILADIDADIEVLEMRLAKTRILKQAMAQALLTGRIRLVEPSA